MEPVAFLAISTTGGSNPNATGSKEITLNGYLESVTRVTYSQPANFTITGKDADTGETLFTLTGNSLKTFPIRTPESDKLGADLVSQTRLYFVGRPLRIDITNGNLSAKACDLVFRMLPV